MHRTILAKDKHAHPLTATRSSKEWIRSISTCPGSACLTWTSWPALGGSLPKWLLSSRLDTWAVNTRKKSAANARSKCENLGVTRKFMFNVCKMELNSLDSWNSELEWMLVHSVFSHLYVETNDVRVGCKSVFCSSFYSVVGCIII